MSRIYDNKPLHNLPVISVNTPNKWDPKKYSSGDGVILEGVIKGRSRFSVTDNSHTKVGRSRFSVTDNSHTKFRYYILHIEVLRAHKRQFESNGHEVEPNFSETHKVRTGYLNSSYKVEPKGQSDKLSTAQVKDIVCHHVLLDMTSPRLPGGCSDCLSLWLEENETEKIELEEGDTVRVKTSGNGPFIYSITRMEAEARTKRNFAGGENVGSSWTDKIMGMKSSQPTDTSQAEGVDEDEWDD
ncbi:arpin-like isoform X1 [Saccostrea cucullata]|uniref:arpin-like isoform X1 n=1 Tax=Saccostrea cuccullata TaxID=36930 RepID=UPI002ED2CAD6